jgi:Flp pilus assembly protein TadD
MNNGQVDRAVVLLQQARTLDANNPTILRDLARAERLQASLNGSGGGAPR